MSDFKGFPQEMIQFFNQLKENNKKEWFDAHRKEYEEYVLQPARKFIVAMGEKLQTISQGINAIPKINKSLFKLHRDIRFSKDKRPFKTHLGIWFWEGDRKRMDCSGFYFHVEDGILMLGTGIHMFSNELLKLYRDAVVDEKHGGKLRKTVEQVSEGGYSIHGKHYKRAPRGYGSSHENMEYLLYNGLTAMTQSEIPEDFFSDAITEYAFTHFKGMLPLHEWLRKALE